MSDHNQTSILVIITSVCLIMITMTAKRLRSRVNDLERVQVLSIENAENRELVIMNLKEELKECRK